MNRKSVLKFFVIIGLSLMLIFNLNSFVSAFDWETVDVRTENDTSSEAEQSEADKSEEEAEKKDEDVSFEEAEKKDENASFEEAEKKDDVAKEAMPYTGAEDTTIIAICVALVGVGGAVYSYKKIRDYERI